MKVHNGTDLKNLFQDNSDDDEDGEEEDSDDDEDESDDDEQEEEEEDSKMDTSAGSTPFKKQNKGEKGDKQKQNKENGASPKKDKPKDNKVRTREPPSAKKNSRQLGLQEVLDGLVHVTLRPPWPQHASSNFCELHGSSQGHCRLVQSVT